MKVYHMSDTLALGAALTPGYTAPLDLARPFLGALARGEDCFFGAFQAARFLGEGLARLGTSGMETDAVKWAVEAVFEDVRRREFPQSVCRLTGNYYFRELAFCRELFREDWGRAPAAERARIRLFEVELEDSAPDCRDMRWFDAAYDGFWEADDDLEPVREKARRYFAGAATDRPVWELLSGCPAVSCRDLTPLLAAEAAEEKGSGGEQTNICFT